VPLTDAGCAYDPAFASDGTLAWAGCADGILVDQLWVRSDQGTRNVLAEHDVSVQGFAWSGGDLWVWTDDGPRTGLLEIRRASGRAGRDRIRAVSLDATTWSALTIAEGGRWAVGRRGRPDGPDVLARLDLRTGRSQLLYDPNPEWAELDVGRAEVVRWEGPDHQPLEGLLHHPPEGIATRGLLVNPHGGPNSVSRLRFGNGWTHAFTGAGYAVFQPNFRGGIGYGRAFYEAVREGRIASVPFADMESGVDAVLADHGFEGTPLYLGGWSYGGYLSAWALGHTARYDAIVVGGVISSRLVQYTMSSNTGRRADFVFGGHPWSQRSRYDAADPNRYLQHATTPTLILHGADDVATPVAHAHILHSGLQAVGVETEMFVYPEERHGGFLPARELHALKTWLAWMEAHAPTP